MHNKYLALAVCAALAACSTELNWREARFDDAPLVALLPCKPDKGARELPLAGRMRQVQMMGCEAGGATFTVAFADVDDASAVAEALAQWKAVSRASQARYFSHQTQVFEAAIFGQPNANDTPSALTQQAAETFFSGIRLPAKP